MDAPSFVDACGRRLEYRRLRAADGNPGRPTLVFLHEGLGSVSLWRDFPDRVAAATGCPALVHSRYGYGRSDVLAAPRDPDYLHVEALEALPQVLERLGVERPLLVGHSDGASIALIHAAHFAGTCGVVAMAPHVFVEDVTLAGIRAAVDTWRGTDLPARLARHHRDAEATFRGWSDIWLAPAFRDWNIEALLPRIACPVLAIQGEGDEYGSMAQVEAIAAAAPRAELLKLSDCGHSPQRDRPEAVIAAIARFVVRLAAQAG